MTDTLPRICLQDMVDDLPSDSLPANWTSFDLVNFSKGKTLWRHNQRALENALKVLWKYYEDFKDCVPPEMVDANRDRKERFFQWYRNNGLEENLDIPLNSNRNTEHLLADYYDSQDGSISYAQFINRASFWMATGSGKTLETDGKRIRIKHVPNHYYLCGLPVQG